MSFKVNNSLLASFSFCVNWPNFYVTLPWENINQGRMAFQSREFSYHCELNSNSPPPPKEKKLMILDPRRQLSLQIRIYRLNCWRVYIFLFLFDHSLYLVCARSAVGRGKVILALSSFSSFPYCFYGYVLFFFSVLWFFYIPLQI